MLISYLQRAAPDKVQIGRCKRVADRRAQRTQFLANQVMFDTAPMDLRGNAANGLLQVIEFGVG